MTSIFPALLDFSLVAVMLLRVAAGFFFLLFGLRLFRAAAIVADATVWIKIVGFGYAALKLVTGGLLLLGVYTQIGALLGIVLTIVTLLQNPQTATHTSMQQVQILLMVMCISLLFLGPGIFAIDMPL